MQILAQSRDKMVNMNHIHALTVSNIGSWNDEKADERNYRILAWNGAGANDCYGLGDYETEDRAKQIIREIFELSGQYLHRKGGPAMLIGSVDIPEEYLVLPKVYEMPEV